MFGGMCGEIKNELLLHSFEKGWDQKNIQGAYDIITKRYGCSMVEWKGKLYCFGGISSLKTYRYLFNDILIIDLSKSFFFHIHFS